MPLTGPGVVITLDDAPARPDGSLPVNARPDDLVIHQSDVQAVVNAVWAAAADGVAVMDQRLIATSAVRCVGNTLLLQGRTYSPPFVITAIVDADAVRAQLAASPQVAVFQQAVDDFGLTFAVRERPEVTLPAYDGPLDLQYAAARLSGAAGRRGGSPPMTRPPTARSSSSTTSTASSTTSSSTWASSGVRCIVRRNDAVDRGRAGRPRRRRRAALPGPRDPGRRRA